MASGKVASSRSTRLPSLKRMGNPFPLRCLAGRASHFIARLLLRRRSISGYFPATLAETWEASALNICGWQPRTFPPRRFWEPNSPCRSPIQENSRLYLVSTPDALVGEIHTAALHRMHSHCVWFTPLHCCCWLSLGKKVGYWSHF